MARTKQLAQVRPANTTAVSAFSPDLNDRITIVNIIICNTTVVPAKYRIFLDADGTTYDESTAIAYDVSLPGNSTTAFEVDLYMNKSTGNLAVRTDTANALTFTVNGIEGVHV